MKNIVPAGARVFRAWRGAGVFLACLLSLAGSAQPAEKGTRTNPIVLGASTDNYPYAYLDEKGILTGFSIEIFDAVARELKLEYRVEQAPREEIYQRFLAGECDVFHYLNRQVFGAIDPIRTFTTPWLAQARYVWVNRHQNIRTLEDLNGRPFAITGLSSRGSIVEMLKGKKIEPEIHRLLLAEEALRGVNSGKYSAVMLSEQTARAMIARNGLKNVVPLGQPLTGYESFLCFAVQEEDPVLLAQLNDGLLLIERNGVRDRIYRKWFGHLEQPFLTRTQVFAASAVLAGLLFCGLGVFLWRENRLHKRLSRQARELEETLALKKALFDRVPVSLCVIEKRGAGMHLITMNRGAEFYFGLPADEVTGQNLNEIRAGQGWTDLLTGLLQRWPEKGEILTEERSCTLGKQHRRLLLTRLPLPDGPGDAPRTCLLIDDVTERREIDALLAHEHRLRALAELVGGIAHEFNNLITPIMLNASLLQLDFASNSRVERELEVILSSTARIAELTDRLLAIGGKNQKKPVAVSLKATVEADVAHMMRSGPAQIEWDLRVPDGLPDLVLDEADLHQIVQNILFNARDTLTEKLELGPPSPWAPRLAVTVELLADKAAELKGHPGVRPLSWQRLEVQDNGRGIEAQIRERMFEPFFTTKGVGKGTGLGLAVVRSLVEKAGGHIDVASTPGEGTTFSVLLPVLEATPVKNGTRPPSAVTEVHRNSSIRQPA